MTNAEAVIVLKRRDDWLSNLLLKWEGERRNPYTLNQEREAIALALAALDYTTKMLEYEASQLSH